MSSGLWSVVYSNFPSWPKRFYSLFFVEASSDASGREREISVSGTRYAVAVVADADDDVSDAVSNAVAAV